MSLEVNFNVGFDDLRPAGEEKGHKIAPIGQIKSQEKNIIWQFFVFVFFLFLFLFFCGKKWY